MLSKVRNSFTRLGVLFGAHQEGRTKAGPTPPPPPPSAELMVLLFLLGRCMQQQQQQAPAAAPARLLACLPCQAAAEQFPQQNIRK